MTDHTNRQHVTDGPCWCNPDTIHVDADDKAGLPEFPEPRDIEVNVVFGAQLRAIVRSALLHVRNKINTSADTVGDSMNIVSDELGKWPLSNAGVNDTLAQWLYNRFAFGRRGARGWEEMEHEDRMFWEHEADAVRRAVGRGGFRDPKDATRSGPETPYLYADQPIRALNHVHAISGGEIKGIRPLNLKATSSLGEAIRIAVGAASTCWTNMMNSGVFKSTEALDISTQLEHHIQAYITKGLGAIGMRHNLAAVYLRGQREQSMTVVPIQDVMDILVGKKDQEAHSTVSYNVEKARCWCGSDVGPRLPSDPWGNGCLADIKHDWTHETPAPAPKTPGYDGPEGTEWGGTAR